MGKLTGWRRIASAMWSDPHDPQVYGSMEFDATPLLALISPSRDLGQDTSSTPLPPSR